MATACQDSLFFSPKFFNVFVILVATFVVNQVSVEAIDNSETYWQGPTRVFEYESYRSTRIFEFHVPTLASKITFVFNEEKSDKECQDRGVQIHLQHGGLPVITPLNETFPEHFYLERSEPHSLHATTSLATTSLTIYGPLPGKWFVAAFLDGAADDRIKQKGFGTECAYVMASTLVMERLDDVQEFGISQEITVTVTDESPTQLRFHTLPDTWEYTIHITDCVFTPANVSVPSIPCPVLLATRGQALPDMTLHERGEVCRDKGAPCDVVVGQPVADTWHNVALQSNSTGNLTLTFHVETQGCVGYFDTLSVQDKGAGIQLGGGNGNETPTVQVNTSMVQPEISTDSEPQQLEIRVESGSKVEVTYVTASTPTPTGTPLTEHLTNTSTNNSCLQVPTMGRFVQGMNFKTQYQLRIGTVPFPNRIRLSATPLILQFQVLPDLDTGGTLYVEVHLITNEEETQNVEMTVCLQKGSLPITSSGVQCAADRHFLVTRQEGKPGLLYIPYVESAMWYLAAQVDCYNNQTGQAEECEKNAALEFDVSITPCVDGGCNGNGFCREYFSGIIHYTSCACIANWRGYGCTDGSHADSMTIQLVEALLLTLSNLAFLPAIILGLYRTFYSEVLVYTFTMFFSTFYHACDGNRKTIYCIMKYEVMAHCDFYGAIMSFWVTLIAMARLPDPVRAFLYMVGALGLAVGVEYDRHSLWTFLVPAALAFLITAGCWIRECHRRRACFPSKRRWLGALLPGLLLAITGLMVFAFLETSANYKYTHSVWHMCMALAVVCILPPRRNKKGGQVEPGDTDPLVMDVRNISGQEVLDTEEQYAVGSSPVPSNVYAEMQDPSQVTTSSCELPKTGQVV